MKKNITIRKYLILIVFIIFSSSFSQENQIVNKVNSDLEIYKKNYLPKEFALKFNYAEERFNIKKLKDFLDDREALLKNLIYALNKNYVDADDQTLLINKITELTKLTKDKKPDDIVDMRDCIYNTISSSPEEKKTEVTRQIAIFENTSNKNIQKSNENQFLIKNISNIKQDIEECQNQINTAVDTEDGKQRFKIIMSICFVLLIALILICFFSIIYLKSDLTLSKDLLGGYGLQFITLFVLIIAIILFGILDILKGGELAAMLSGISGYILGKGIQDKKLLTENINTTPTSTVASVTIATDQIIPVNPDPAS